MAKTDSPFNDLLIALHLLTRLPLPRADWSNETRPHARAAWAYPLVGGVIGTLSTALAWAALAFGLAPELSAVFAVGAAILFTGAMHEDGLADCADGFWGGWEPARRLEIMKDSQIGTYGVLALVLVFVMKWVALAEIFASGTVWPLIIAAILSRAAMVAVMELLPHARETGLSRDTGQPGFTSVCGALLLGAVAAFTLGFLAGLVLLLVATIITSACAALAKQKIGGQTGDVLGAAQCLCEACLLITLSILLA